MPRKRTGTSDEQTPPDSSDSQTPTELTDEELRIELLKQVPAEQSLRKNTPLSRLYQSQRSVEDLCRSIVAEALADPRSTPYFIKRMLNPRR